MRLPTKPFYLGFTAIFCMLFKVHGQMDPQSLLNKYLDNRDTSNAYQAEVDFEMKWFNTDDTFRCHADIEIVRVPDDSLFGGILYFEFDSLIFAYTGDVLLRADKISDSIEIETAIEHPNLWIKSTWVNNFVEYGFLTRNQDPRTILSNADIKHKVVDTLIGERPCKGFHYYLPDEDGFTGMHIFTAIDTLDHIVRKRTVSIWYQENEQFQSWTFHHPAYGQHTSIARLEGDFLSGFKKKDEYNHDETDTTAYKLVDYSTLEGKILGKDKSFAIKEIEADVIILDFWYSACYPCIKSIPEVNKLHEMFKGKNVQVFGVNIIDNEAANQSRIEKYLRNNPMSYETIMADGARFGSWVTDGYPTLLVLDKDLKLIESHTGFNEQMAEEIALIVEDQLKN